MQIFNTIHFKNLKGDIWGGATTAIVSLPLALAFGIASGAGPEAGLYGAIIIGLFASLFGGTPTLISEPTGPMTVVMTAIVTTMIAQNPENGLAMAFTVVMIAGIFQILLGFLKLGKYITLMPYSVISGFMSGIGLLLIIFQFAPFIGLSNPPGNALEKIQALPALVHNIHLPSALLGIGALFILLFTPKRVSRYVPAQLIALVLGLVIFYLFFREQNVPVIGEISLGIPNLYLPTFTQEQIVEMVLDGMVLGTLGCIDSLLTSVISDSLTRQEHKSDKELIGQGIGNLFSGMLGGLPGAGATMGTVVNIQSGAKTALSGIIRALTLVICIVGAAQITQHVPLAVLAAIALKVGIDILDWSFIKRAHKISLHASVIMYGVITLTVFVDLIVAVGLGVFIANVLTIQRLSEHQSENSIKAISDTDDAMPLSAEEKSLLKDLEGKTLFLYFSGPLIFGMTKAISRQRGSIHRFDSLVLDLSDVPIVDTTSLLAIENTVLYAKELNKKILVVSNTPKINSLIEKLDLQAKIFDNRLTALNYISGRYKYADMPMQVQIA